MLFPIGRQIGNLGSMRMVEKLEAALHAKGFTQTSFERLAMLSANRISKWKNDHGEPTARQAMRIARLLGLSVEYLVDDDLNEMAPDSHPEAERKVREAVQELGYAEAYRRLLITPDHSPSKVVLNPTVNRPGVNSPARRKGAG